MSDPGFDFEGTRIPLQDGASVGASLWAAGIRDFRRTRFGHSPRALFCAVGSCFDCLVDVRTATGAADGAAGVRPVRACRTPATPGLAVARSGSVARPGSPAESDHVARSATGVADVVVVGAGPAGVAAAAAAHAAGADVLLLDAAAAPGGQIYRRSTLVAGADDEAERSVGRYLPHTRVVLAESCVDGSFRLHLDAAGDLPTSSGAETETGTGTGTGPLAVRARAVVLCTGATEVVAPFPGWTTPGVMTAGGMQALLKGDGVRGGARVLLAGTGPLLLPVAAALASAGARVVLADEAVTGAGAALGAAARSLRHPAKLGLATVLGATLARHGVRVRPGWRLDAVRGEPGDPVLPLRAHLSAAGGRTRVLAVDAVGVSHGLAADVGLAGQLGATRRPPVAGQWGRSVVVDADGATDVPGLYAAGEATGVGGASAAAVEGTLAGLAAARGVGRPVAARRLAAARRRVAHEKEWGRVLASLWPVPDGWWARLPDDELLCRCEEVPAGAVRGVVAGGARTARAVKGRTRVGMGLCQGRVCGPLLGQVLAATGAPGSTPPDAWLDTRPLSEPVTLARLAVSG